MSPFSPQHERAAGPGGPSCPSTTRSLPSLLCAPHACGPHPDLCGVFPPLFVGSLRPLLVSEACSLRLLAVITVEIVGGEAAWLVLGGQAPAFSLLPAGLITLTPTCDGHIVWCQAGYSCWGLGTGASGPDRAALLSCSWGCLLAREQACKAVSHSHVNVQELTMVKLLWSIWWHCGISSLPQSPWAVPVRADLHYPCIIHVVMCLVSETALGLCSGSPKQLLPVGSVLLHCQELLFLWDMPFFCWTAAPKADQEQFFQVNLD